MVDDQGKSEKEIVPVDEVNKTVQTANKYTALEVAKSEKEEDNQLALVEQINVHRNPISNPTPTGKSLNSAALVYKPTSPRIEASKDITNAGVEGSGNVNNQTALKESTV